MFNIYSGTALVEIIRVEWRNLGPFQFLIAGFPATFLFDVLVAVKYFLIGEVGDVLIKWITSQIQSEQKKIRVTKLLHVGASL